MSGNILVLGITGMLGSMVFNYLNDSKDSVYGTIRRNKSTIYQNNNNIIYFDATDNIANQIKNIFNKIKFDYIVNCIGVINKYCENNNVSGINNAININSLFPHLLSQVITKLFPNTKIIQIATDCVYSGKTGGYDENSIHDADDIYGKSKSLGEVKADNFLNIRCSIIGPEVNNKSSLLEWFLALKKNTIVPGFAHHFWNGLTTLQFAEYCDYIISTNNFYQLRNLNYTIHLIKNKSITKYDLLCIFKDVFYKDVEILKETSIVEPINRTLKSIYLNENNLISMNESIIELRKYILKTNFINKKE